MQPKKIKKVPPKKLAESSSEESEQENDALCIYCSEPYGNSVEGEGWIQCSRCPQWTHDACAGIDENAWDDFICDLGTFQCKKTKMASISGISESVTMLKIFHLNMEQSIIVGYQF
jgi:hypothetical protein